MVFWYYWHLYSPFPWRKWDLSNADLVLPQLCLSLLIQPIHILLLSSSPRNTSFHFFNHLSVILCAQSNFSTHFECRAALCYSLAIPESRKSFLSILFYPNLMDHCAQFKIALAPLAIISYCKLICNLSSIISIRSPLVLLFPRFLLFIGLFYSRCICFHISKLNHILLFFTHITAIFGFMYIS